MAKMITIRAGEDLSALTALCIQRAKRDDKGSAQTAVYLTAVRPESGDEGGETALYLVDSIDAKQGAGNGTTLRLVRIGGSGFPSVATVTNRAPLGFDLAMVSESDALGFFRAVEAETVPVALNAAAPPAAKPAASKPRAEAASVEAIVSNPAFAAAIAQAARMAQAELAAYKPAAAEPVAAEASAEAAEASAEAAEATAEAAEATAEPADEMLSLDDSDGQ